MKVNTRLILKGVRIICAAIAFLGGVFSYSLTDAAYGPGQQFEKYPQIVADTRLVLTAQKKIKKE
ncbi:MAG: hypothetical protein IKN43_14025 [Selenomonadaceae bacterium]|nr:hypothetical protein [Selenomonadaceae bacterium]